MTLTTKYQPLYQQVYDEIVKRLGEGFWKAGDSLPSEFALAEELGVSQGTVRKALNQLVAENILRRRQGKGTYVAEHSNESSLYRFFRYREKGGKGVIPETKIISVLRREPSELESSKLSLDCGSDVVEMVRLRSIQDKPAIFEKVIQPLSVFPGIDRESEYPNSLYALYQEKYGISIVEVRDELHAVKLEEEVAKQLNLPVGSAALMTQRSSINIDGRVVEWSQAYCSTENFVYSVTLK
ncbi:GntR family transcriptional regulator [Arenicella sp. 4NH20-0111]|uniref:GntR family transcriptional regulator n=1 Tax=Arenicella sp. 4NH20-0111 TaxID=3127648 RepID=UPI003102C8FE